MNYIQILFILSFFSGILSTNSNPNNDLEMIDTEDKGNVSITSDNDEEEINELVIASYLFQMFDLTYNAEFNDGESPDKSQDFKFLKIEDDEDWKVKAKMTGFFKNIHENLEFPVNLNLLEFYIAGPDSDIPSSKENEYIELSTVEISNVEHAYRVILTAQDQQGAFEKIAQINDGLQIDLNHTRFDTIQAVVNTHEDQTTVLSMNIYVLKKEDESEVSFIDQEIEFDNESNESEASHDIMVEAIDPKKALENAIHQNFSNKLQEAKQIDQNSNKKFLV